ncbi:hypothetical protein PMI23_01406, partial [Pseudomonas sp. GM24]
MSERRIAAMASAQPTQMLEVPASSLA